MHHGTDILDSLSPLELPTIWGSRSSAAPTRRRVARRNPWAEGLLWLGKGMAFAATVSLCVALLAVLD